MIKQLRKGVIVALLLDLDIPPSSADLDEARLSIMNKAHLENMLWDMVSHEFRSRRSLIRGLR